jgi:hypothetical protein
LTWPISRETISLEVIMNETEYYGDDDFSGHVAATNFNWEVYTFRLCHCCKWWEGSVSWHGQAATRLLACRCVLQGA